MQKSENLQLHLITNSMDDAAMTFLEYRDKVSGASDDSNMQIIDRAFGEMSADMEAASEPLEKADQLPYEKHAVTGNTVTLTGLYDSANITKLVVTLEPTPDGDGSFVSVVDSASTYQTVLYGNNPVCRMVLMPYSYSQNPIWATFDTDSGGHTIVTVDKITGCEIDYTNLTFKPTWGLVENYPGTYDFPGRWLSSADTYSAGTRPSAGANVAFELQSPRTYEIGSASLDNLSFSSGAQQLLVTKSNDSSHTAMSGFVIDTEYWSDGYRQDIQAIANYLPAIQAYNNEYFISHFWGTENTQMSDTIGNLRITRLYNNFTLSGSVAQADTSSGVLNIALSYRAGKCNPYNSGTAKIDPVLKGDSLIGKYYVTFEHTGGTVGSGTTIELYATGYPSGSTGKLCDIDQPNVINGSVIANSFLRLAINIGNQASVSFSNYAFKIGITRVDGLADLIS